MRPDEIMAMAEQAHRALVTQDYPGHRGQLDPWTLRLLERFAALVAAREREACAQVCDAEAERALFNWHSDLPSNQQFWNGAAQFASACSSAIRARGSL